MSDQPQCSASLFIANVSRHSAGHLLPAELISEIVQALPIARCAYSSSVSYVFTPFRPFVIPRYHAAIKLMRANTELDRRIVELYNRVIEQYDQLIKLLKKLTEEPPVSAEEAEEIVAKKREMQKKIEGWRAEIGGMKRKSDEFGKAWERSELKGGIGQDDKPGRRGKKKIGSGVRKRKNEGDEDEKADGTEEKKRKKVMEDGGGAEGKKAKDE